MTRHQENITPGVNALREGGVITLKDFGFR
jgi:hypothetical protein